MKNFDVPRLIRENNPSDLGTRNFILDQIGIQRWVKRSFEPIQLLVICEENVHLPFIEKELILFEQVLRSLSLLIKDAYCLTETMAQSVYEQCKPKLIWVMGANIQLEDMTCPIIVTSSLTELLANPIEKKHLYLKLIQHWS